MTEHQITITRHVAAPPETVWEVLTDVDHAAETLSGVTRVEVLTEGTYAVGTRWRETRRMMGKEETQEMYVTEVEAPARTTIEAETAGVHYVSTFTLSPRDAGTELSMTFGGHQPDPSGLQKLAWTVFGRLGLKMTRKVMVRDLEDIAKRAEGAA